jgi:hypothetical protein
VKPGGQTASYSVSCQGKEQFSSYRQAARAIERSTRNWKRSAGTTRVSVYRCPCCAHFHLGARARHRLSWWHTRRQELLRRAIEQSAMDELAH